MSDGKHHHHGHHHGDKDDHDDPPPAYDPDEFVPSTNTEGAALTGDPPEYTEARLQYEQQQKQAEHDAAMARIMSEDAQHAENDAFDQEMHEQSIRKAQEEVTSQRALLSVNRNNMIPSYHGWIQWFLINVNGWVTLVGLGIVVGAIWAYLKDLHLVHTDADQLLFLQIMLILMGIMIFAHGQLGLFAFKKPDKARKWVISLSLLVYFIVTLISMFMCLFCTSVIYNSRIEMKVTQAALYATYEDPKSDLIGVTPSTLVKANGEPLLPEAPPYLYNELVFARYFNLIFFGAASHDFDTDPYNDACIDSVFISLWYYVGNHCPDLLIKSSCAHCGEFAVVNCGAYEPTCRANFEGEDIANYADRNLGCPYQICRTAMIDDGIGKITYFQYFMELVVGFQILVCISTIVYGWEYGQYYQTQEEINECYKEVNMQNGIYKRSQDLNDIIVRTKMMDTIVCPTDSLTQADQPDARGRYDHTYRAPSEGGGAAAAGGGTLVSPGNSPAARRQTHA